MAISGQSKLHYQVLQNLALDVIQNPTAHTTETPATLVTGLPIMLHYQSIHEIKCTSKSAVTNSLTLDSQLFQQVAHRCISP